MRGTGNRSSLLSNRKCSIDNRHNKSSLLRKSRRTYRRENFIKLKNGPKVHYIYQRSRRLRLDCRPLRQVCARAYMCVCQRESFSRKATAPQHVYTQQECNTHINNARTRAIVREYTRPELNFRRTTLMAFPLAGCSRANCQLKSSTAILNTDLSLSLLRLPLSRSPFP